ncbi:MAG: DUF501 domain-containing protein, partial [Actinomycetota bacterium]|nr:DUF501 domain-containing protein [Actinomycetota bacterium]
YASAVTVAGVVHPARPAARGSRPPVPSGRRSRTDSRASHAARAAVDSGLDEVVVVVADESSAGIAPAEATVLLDGAEQSSESSALRAALDWCARSGHDAVVVATSAASLPRPGPDAVADPSTWGRLARASRTPVAVATWAGRPVGLVRIGAEAWPLLPLTGPVEVLWRSRPELVTSVALDGPDAGGSRWARPSPEDVAAVERLLGRPVSGDFAVVVRGREGAPVVIENAPFLRDGTPMPTRYWLVGDREREAVGRLEAAGGVRRAEESVLPEAVAAAHARYAAGRDAAIPSGHSGPAPSGGVGGTRTGVKCLHAHLAWYLAGGRDPVGRWVAGEIAGSIEGPVAAVDCGTNSTRLVVVDASGETIDRRMTITRLGAGVDETGVLEQGAVERTLSALRDFREVMDAHGVVAVRAIATSAARDARNSEELLVPGGSVLGVPIEPVGGEEEGLLSYRGATGELDPADGPYLVVDLGGGSTELVVAEGGDASSVSVASLDVGCVRVTERFFATDPPATAEIEAASGLVDRLVAGALQDRPALRGARRMVGVAGTVSALAVLDAGLDHYEREAVHHRVLRRDRVVALADDLCSRTTAERAARPGVERERADVLAGGALVLARVMLATGHEELVASESDILDGMATELLGRCRADAAPSSLARPR